jgi:hypothetical protein
VPDEEFERKLNDGSIDDSVPYYVVRPFQVTLFSVFHHHRHIHIVLSGHRRILLDMVIFVRFVRDVNFRRINLSNDVTLMPSQASVFEVQRQWESVDSSSGNSGDERNGEPAQNLTPEKICPELERRTLIEQ